MRECEELIKCVHSKAFSRLELTSGDLPEVSHVRSMQKVEGLIHLDHYRTKGIVWPFCYLVTRTRDSS